MRLRGGRLTPRILANAATRFRPHFDVNLLPKNAMIAARPAAGKDPSGRSSEPREAGGNTHADDRVLSRVWDRALSRGAGERLLRQLWQAPPRHPAPVTTATGSPAPSESSGAVGPARMGHRPSGPGPDLLRDAPVLL